MKLPFASLLYVFVAATLMVAPPVALAADDDEDADGDEGEESGEKTEEEVPMPDDSWETPPLEEEKAPEKAAVKKTDEPVTDGKHIQVGMTLGWAFTGEKHTAFATDEWNFGAGLRAGYIFEHSIYGGLFYAYFLGDSDTHGQLMAAEFGFDWWVGGVAIIRPSLDLGLAHVEGKDIKGVKNMTTKQGFYIGPGVVVTVPMGLMYVGGELRQMIVTGDLQSATMVSGNIGVRL